MRVLWIVALLRTTGYGLEATRTALAHLARGTPERALAAAEQRPSCGRITRKALARRNTPTPAWMLAEESRRARALVGHVLGVSARGSLLNPLEQWLRRGKRVNR